MKKIFLVSMNILLILTTWVSAKTNILNISYEQMEKGTQDVAGGSSHIIIKDRPTTTSKS